MSTDNIRVFFEWSDRLCTGNVTHIRAIVESSGVLVRTTAVVNLENVHRCEVKHEYPSEVGKACPNDFKGV